MVGIEGKLKASSFMVGVGVWTRELHDNERAATYATSRGQVLFVFRLTRSDGIFR